MKTINGLTCIAFILIHGSLFSTDQDPTSAEVVQSILNSEHYRELFIETSNAIDALLADERVTNQHNRQMLTASKTAIEQMLNQKTSAGSPQLVDLVIWIDNIGREIANMRKAEAELSTELVAYSDSELFNNGYDAGLTIVLRGVLGESVRIDRESCPPALLEAYLQLYLKMRPFLEDDSLTLPDKLLIYVPQWIQSRYLQLTTEEKWYFLDRVNRVRAERARNPNPEPHPEFNLPTPTPQEKEDYEAAYQFILANTPLQE